MVVPALFPSATIGFSVILDAMKIGCRCGEVIPDQTDFLAYKAYLVADQDWFDVLDEVTAGSERRSLLEVATRQLWQCRQCGVLYLEDHEGALKAFAPLDEPPSTGLLRSYLQDRWKRPMGADWRAGRDAPGQLWWNGPDDDAGWEEFTDWLGLERR